MPASTSSDDEIDERREPNTWRDVEDTINDEEDPMEDVFLSTLVGESADQKPLVLQDDLNRGKFVDPLGILRMPPRTFAGKPQSIDDEKYDPVGQLSGLHMSTTFSELVQGTRRLNRKLSSQEADIKQLVRDNFDRFISCKDVIDGIYERISENEQSASGNSTRQVENTVREVLARANRVYEPLLTRKAETEKIRQSLSVLSRFSFLFTLPSKIATNIREGEYDKAVQHYKKAASIFQDQASIAHISVFMHVFTEVENIVAGFRTTLYTALADPSSSFEAQERVIRILVDLARPSDFRINPEKDPKDDPGWYYLHMASSRMISRLSSVPSSAALSSSPSSFTLTLTAPPPDISPDSPHPTNSNISHQISHQNSNSNLNNTTSNTNAVYRSVRSACGHVARHLPNLWKMGQHYLQGKFDPKNYGSDDKGKEEMQAHPTQDKEKLDKAATVRVYFSDETTTVRVDSRKPCQDLVELCLRRVEGDHSADNYAIFTWIEKRKKDGTKVIKITELGPGERINKLHKKWGDKSGISHRFLFKRKDEKFPQIHDPRTVVEDYTLEMRSSSENSKKKQDGKSKVGKKTEEDFHQLLTSVLDVFAERVEAMFFLDNSEDDFESDFAATTDESTEEWAFGKMRAQVLDVVTTLNILQRAGMTEKYLLPVNKLTLRLSGHYVARLCGQWATEVALLYLSVPSSSSSSSHYHGVLLDSSVGLPIVVERDKAETTANLTTVFAETTKFYLDQFKGIISKGHPLMTQVQMAFGDSLKSFADTLHHLAFRSPSDDDDDFDPEDNQPRTTAVHRQLKIVAYILETRNVVIANLWSHFNEMFKLVSTHQVEEDVLSSPLEVFHHLGNMTVARYIHDRLTVFNKIVRNGIVVSPTTDWSTSLAPTSVSEFAMSILLHFVYASSELAILESSSSSNISKSLNSNSERTHNRRESRSVFDKADRHGLLDGNPEEVIKKLMGVMVWGTMEGIRQSLNQLDRPSVSVCGILQLRLDFCFIESILSRYITEEAMGIAKTIHAVLSQMEEDAYQSGAGEDAVEVDLEQIIEDTSRRAVVLFGSLTGNAEAPTIPKIASLPKRGLDPRARKLGSPMGAEMKFGKESKLADVLRSRARNGTTSPPNKETERDYKRESSGSSGFFSLKKQDEKEVKATEKSTNNINARSNNNINTSGNGIRSPPPDASVSQSNRERLLERQREKVKEREREREREREQKEKEERSKKPQIQEKDGASGNGEVTSRSIDREKLLQREREKRKAR